MQPAPGIRLLLRLALSLAALALAEPIAATGSGELQPYFALRGGAAHLTEVAPVGGIELAERSDLLFPQLALGANLTRHWGVELAVNYAETDVEALGVTGRLGEYAIWTLLGQARFRYPLFDERFVPYLVGGLGAGIGEFNDRNAAHLDVPFRGPLDTSFAASLGGGFEYFIASNLALDVEVKHTFAVDTGVTAGGRSGEFDLDHLMASAGLRMYFADVREDADLTPPPAGTGRARIYLIFRTGAAFLTAPESSSLLEISSPARVDWGSGIGLNLSDRWGLELVGDYYEPNLSAPGVGEVAEYALWTVLAHLRYRWPLANRRLVPYVVAGGGLGVAEINDRKVPFDAFPIEEGNSTSVVGSLGAGLEHYLMRNIAIGGEVRHLFGFDNDVSVGARTVNLDNDSVVLTAHIRVLFP